MSAVVALAGHVDHGKSALVAALTGARTDRLVHESRSGHTIEVRPAHLDDGSATLLDAPGHADWLDATVAGLGAATHALLVVAADDGPMPQTRDHVRAIAALRLPVVAVAITRSDLADRDRVTRSAAATRDLLVTHGLAAPTIVTSTADGTGLADLRSVVRAARAPTPVPPLDGPDLWVDRTFVVPGRGRVVVGTLRRGTVRVGDDLVAAPDGATLRVRGLQQRGDEVDALTAVGRVALRVTPGEPQPRGTRLVGAEIARHGLLAGPLRAIVANLGTVDLRRRGSWLLYAGTTVVATEVRCDRPVGAGRTGAATIVPRGAVPLRPGDRFVLRDTGRRRVVGGGTVLVAGGRSTASADDLRVLEAAFAAGDRPAVREGLARVHGGTVDRHLLATVLPPARDTTATTATTPLRSDVHRRASLLLDTAEEGLPIATVASRIAARTGLDEAEVRAVLAEGPFERRGPTLYAGSAPPVEDRPRSDALESLVAAGLAPPRLDELSARHDLPTDVLLGLVRDGRAHLAGRHLFAAEAVDRAIALLDDVPDPFTVADARDAWGVTRRHAVPLLELLDRLGATRRVGDLRQRVAPAPTSRHG